MEDIRKYEILCEQEETLRFDSFNNEDAWKLGCMLKDRQPFCKTFIPKGASCETK